MEVPEILTSPFHSPSPPFPPSRTPWRPAVTASALILAVIVVGCGRSAPEEAAPVPGDGTEPTVAGIQVVSDEPVITPQPTVAPPSTTATSVAAAGPGGSYVVEPGDTLSVIAEQFGVSVEALSQANGITDVNTIKPGQELTIPG